MGECQAELCHYWPGEGCMRGILPCGDVMCFLCGATGDLMRTGACMICIDEAACRERLSGWRPTGLRA